MIKVRQIFGTILFCGLISGCASVSLTNQTDAVNDPLEPMNRTIFAFNEVIDAVLLRPVATTYHDYVPQGVQDSVHNVFDTIKQPAHFVNALLQGNFQDAGSILGRTGVNLTFGLCGLFDVASQMNIPKVDHDFGQTLAKWGWRDGGPYLMLPLLGPSNPRDTLGWGADIWIDPVAWEVRDNKAVLYSGYALRTIDVRTDKLKLLDNLKNSSTDYYAAMRSMYLQNRQKQINSVLPHQDQAAPEYDFDFEISDE